jgi:hypothetical protein
VSVLVLGVGCRVRKERLVDLGRKRREETNWDLGRERERTRKRREKAGMRWMFKQSSAKNSRDGWVKLVKRPTHRRVPA